MLDLGEQEVFVGYKEAAEWSGMSVDSLKALASRGKVPRTTVGGTSYIPRRPLEEYLLEANKHPDPWPDKSIPRLIRPGGGYEDPYQLSDEQVGNSGENLASFILGAAGATVSLVVRTGMDHFVRLPNGGMFALEVKTTRGPYHLERKPRWSTYFCGYKVQRRDAEWFCFVDLSSNLCLFKSREDLPKYSKVHITTSHFTEFHMHRTFVEMCGSFGYDLRV
jgi:hypothetical protein